RLATAAAGSVSLRSPTWRRSPSGTRSARSATRVLPSASRTTASTVPGGRFWAGAGLISPGSYGASHGAASGGRTAASSRPTPQSRVAEKRRRPPDASVTVLLLAHRRIGRGVQQVGHQAAGGHESPGQRGGGEEDRIVASAHGDEGQPADAGPGEDRLDDQRSAEQAGEGDAEELNHRRQRVAQAVDTADGRARLVETEDQRRQGQVAEKIEGAGEGTGRVGAGRKAAGREDPPDVGEEEDGHQAEPEQRLGVEEKRNE